MVNDFYKIYRQDCTRLAETMVIRFDAAAVATNRYLEALGFIVEPDRRTWRYYMNMAGLYHSTNLMMQVLSLDTGEMIDFTVDNLQIHRATARGYAHGSRYYNDLLSRHPKQESLILGVLNPVDINEAINARENQILWMDSTLIEANEDNLLELIQEEIDAFLERWTVEMYAYIDDLYAPARLAVFGASLPNMIFSARLKNERTNRAHSFFIRQHLARYGRLDKYMDAMTKDQQLFFYRNAVHFHKYPGHDDSFKWLIDKVLADRDLPIASHQLLQDETEVVANLVPAIELNRHELTRHYRGIPDTKVTVPTIAAKQATLATYNSETEDVNIGQTTDKMQMSKVNQLTTKVLESKVYDLTDSLTLKLEDLLISNWAYLSRKNQYIAITPFTDQRTGEVFNLSAADTFVLFLYSYNRSIEVVLEEVPVITANHIKKQPIPTVAALYDMTSKKYYSRALVQQLRDMIPDFGQIISTENFYNTVHAMWSGALRQQTLASLKGHFIARGELETIAEFMFHDVGVDLADRPGQTFSQWLNERGLSNVENYTPYEFAVVWPDLLNRATGMDLNATMSLAYIHRAMIGVMERLSSYSVQYIREINNEPLKAIAKKWVWPGDSDGNASSEGLVAMPHVDPIWSDGKGTSLSNLEVGFTSPQESDGIGKGDSFHEIGLDIWSGGSSARESYVRMPVVRPISDEFRYPTIIDGSYESDTELEPTNPIGTPIAMVLLRTDLSGLNLPSSPITDIGDYEDENGLPGFIYPLPGVVDLNVAIGNVRLGGFIPTPVARQFIGDHLVNRDLQGLNLPL